ncbi:MAG: AraC family transcriptional regulator [Planctomycetota bacterium]|nr:AraC family transcriptional regulator [Planctomycetota bacterium]
MRRLAHNPPSTPWARTGEPLLWLNGAGHEVISSGDPYYYDCRKRPDPHYAFQLTLKGKGLYERDGRTTLLTPGMAFVDFMPGDFRYGFPPGSTEDYEIVWLDLDGPAAEALWNHVNTNFGRVVSLGPVNPVAPLALAIAYQHAHERHHDRYLLSSQLYEVLMTLLSVLNRSRVTTAPLVTAALDLIHRKGLDRDCNVEWIAENLSCSREHFTRIFREAIGVGPGEYLIQHRIRSSIRMLLDTRDKLEKIARRCGFSGANYYCRVFRERTNLTPKAFREQPWIARGD